MQTNIVKWGNSQGIRLPKMLLDSVNLAESDTVDVIAENGRIVIKKADNKRRYKTIQERFKDFHGEYEPIDTDWGKPVGRELW
ncbi:antitoxin MazE [Peptococcaceae bacterium CEB3]|nr:antitoxin MazE [Peptococcaceae bacterium CEB3]